LNKFFLLFVLFLISFSSHAAVSEWTDFKLVHNHITLDVVINGVESTAILDSGAEVNGISEFFAERHGKNLEKGRKVTMKGAFSEEKVSLYKQVPIKLFGVDFTLEDVVPLSIVGKGLILGQGFFKNFVIQIDYPNRKLRIMSHDAIDLERFANVPMSKQKYSALPIVKANLNQELDTWLMFDTGNSGGILVDRRTANRYNWLTRFPTSSNMSHGAFSMAQTDSFILPSMKIGPYEMGDVKVTVPAEGQKTNTLSDKTRGSVNKVKGKDSLGIIGYDVMKHFIVTIDYKNYLLHLGVPN